MVTGIATRRHVERWSSVRGFERYEVSNLGRVKNRETGYILRPYLNDTRPGYDYLRVKLVARDGRRRAFYVHRLVAEYYAPGRSRERRHVHHKNEVHHDNRAENLVWVTPEEHAELHGAEVTGVYGEPIVEAPF